MSLFCRHNRFTADCPICSKGTVLDSGGSGAPRKRPSAARRSPAAEKPAARAFTGPHVAAPARTRGDVAPGVVGLERDLGGVRLGEWSGSALEPRAPVLPASDLADIVARSAEALQARDAARLVAAIGAPPDPRAGGDAGVSRGRSGDFKEELRIERLQDGLLRVARWVLRPAIGWELQDAPPMLPAARYAEALADAARRGLIPAAAQANAASRA
ncbi:MAG: hypothetical protein WD993_02035 [Thermoleophilaceae bacterium]